MAAERSRQSSGSSLTTFYTSMEVLEQDTEQITDGNRNGSLNGNLVADADVDCGGEATAASTLTGHARGGYRVAGEMPRDLRSHCSIFLEEELYMSAINLLNSMLAAGASRRGRSDQPVPIPPASYLALINTITIHPLHTTRVEKPDHLDVSCLAMAYMRNVLATVGPVQADFGTAFRFQEVSRRRRATQGGAPDGDGDHPMDGESDLDRTVLTGRLANEGSLWSQGKDFWAVVGWALNCCTGMPRRWRYWKVWMEFMLDVLEADWDERQRMDEEMHAHRDQGAGGKEEEEEEPTAARAESMIAMYMGQQHQHGMMKEIVKALLTYAGGPSSASFKEVFPKEHRVPKQPMSVSLLREKRKREMKEEQEDLKEVHEEEAEEEGGTDEKAEEEEQRRKRRKSEPDFTEYLDDDALSSGISEPPTPRKPRGGSKGARVGDPPAQGMVESVPLRLRLFKLLSAAVFTLRRHGRRGDLDVLYDEFKRGVAALPLDLFAAVVTQRPNALLLETHLTLTCGMFHALLPNSIKKPARVDPEAFQAGGLSVRMLAECYACNAACGADVEYQAKVSLLVESAVQLLWTCGALGVIGDGNGTDGVDGKDGTTVGNEEQQKRQKEKEQGQDEEEEEEEDEEEEEGRRCMVETLARAVELGIDARERKVGRKSDRGRKPAGGVKMKGTPEEEHAGDVLRLSAERLRVLLAVLRGEAGDE